MLYHWVISHHYCVKIGVTFPLRIILELYWLQLAMSKQGYIAYLISIDKVVLRVR
jgi:hypothetical protein